MRSNYSQEDFESESEFLNTARQYAIDNLMDTSNFNYGVHSRRIKLLKQKGLSGLKVEGNGRVSLDVLAQSSKFKDKVRVMRTFISAYQQAEKNTAKYQELLNNPPEEPELQISDLDRTINDSYETLSPIIINLREKSQELATAREMPLFFDRDAAKKVVQGIEDQIKSIIKGLNNEVKETLMYKFLAYPESTKYFQ